jgi:hypothetical protein
MPLFEIISGETNGTNGNSPKRHKKWAKDFDDAAWKAPILGGGRIVRVSEVVEYDEDNQWAIYNVRTSKEKSFPVYVQHLWWIKKIRIL